MTDPPSSSTSAWRSTSYSRAFCTWRKLLRFLSSVRVPKASVPTGRKLTLASQRNEPSSMAANHPLARVPILALGRNPVPARTQDLDRIPALSLVLAPVRALGPAPGDRLLVLVRGDRRPPM